MRYNTIIIDVSNVYHRAYHVRAGLTNNMADGTVMVTDGVYTSIKMIRKIESTFLSDGGTMFFIFDNAKSGVNRRKAIDPEYKSNREDHGFSFFRGLDFLNLILMNYKDSYRVVKRPGSEADDLVTAIVAEYPQDRHLMVSNDMDWSQVLSDTVHLAKYERGDYRIYTPEYFKERFGFVPTPESVALYKTFRGDKSDNIPNGLPGIREKDLIRLIQEKRSLEEVVEDLSQIEYISDTFKHKLVERLPRLRLNYKLVTLEKVPYRELKEYIFVSKFNPRTLKSLYQSLGFDPSSFDRRVQQMFPEKRTAKNFFSYDKVERE